ncbi:hypothetical protein K431DRAFT_288749 [Polychaeton citri CBS 116435]|uniref:Zn(2)-C6 fungal-type domain-containing protein n=1 Tax=Polychaeton citri CBS 116435 TaxID=1314669 RepID=A0A9P4UK96_9PEZI|nr:hypothetical protein K431DRAFT_288749 [Polychaeton citri CBS 116435]
MIPKSAGRTPIACSNCAKTKTKCDKKFPCSRCAGRNLKCTLRPTRRATKNAQRMGIPLEGAVAYPPGMQPDQLPNGVQAITASPPQQPPTIKPASPKTSSEGSPKSKPAAPAVDGPPAQFIEQPTSGPTPPHGMSPPMPTPGVGFIQTTPLSGFDEFQGMSKETSDAGSSPRFMLDWSQMPMPMGYEQMVTPQMVMHTEVPFTPQAMQHPIGMHHPGVDTMMPVMPQEFPPGVVPPLITPIETPKVERAFSDLELGSSAAVYRSQNRNMSTTTMSDGKGNNDMPAIVAARDSWSVFRCTPNVPSSSCPTTARLNLERLEQSLRDHEGWSTWSPHWEDADYNGHGDHLTVMQLHESTRDKLLAITQSFLHKALDIHREKTSHNASGMYSPASHSASNFVLLPPARVLEYFLRSYANCFERYYPLTSRGILDSNELLHCYNDRAASLLVLMMIAQGAMNIPSIEARSLTGGLTEACRISLFDLIEKNIVMSGDPIVLHAALLFTVQAAWSGDKWQMDIAMGQRGMYNAMLRHSGVLDNCNPVAVNQQDNPNQLWSDWISRESRSRLIYSWAMVDQDLSLFHDTAPLFSVTEFAVPMPDTDRLWHAKTVGEWSAIFEQVHEFSGGYSSIGSGARPLSLRDLFRHFLDDELLPLGIEMTPLQMRLLLHPLQSLVHQCGQLLSCFSDSSATLANQNKLGISVTSTRTRLAEVQTLLTRWFDLAERYLKANPMCAMMQTNLVMFHLISLNAVTNFPEIERLGRREGLDGSYQQLMWMHKRCISDIEEAVYHCGQVLRLIRSMPRGIRPPWWAGAIYRVALILWTDSLAHNETVSPSNNGMFPVPGPSFAIDALGPEHPLIVRYLTKREGVPCVTKRDGSQMGIDRPYPLLQHCIELLDEGASTRFSDGIRSKLDRLARG